MCQFYSDSSRFFLPTVKHSKRRKKRTKTHVFSKDRAKFVTGLRHQTERDRRYHAREHILVVLVSCYVGNVDTRVKQRSRDTKRSPLMRRQVFWSN
jgi:hypothetical protein